VIGDYFQSEQLVAGAKRLGEDIEASVRLAISNGEQAWRDHYSWTEQELRKYSENLNGEFQNELKQTQVCYLPLLCFMWCTCI
jgi:hypothetical protein